VAGPAAKLKTRFIAFPVAPLRKKAPRWLAAPELA